jgi:hypothetical protein
MTSTLYALGMNPFVATQNLPFAIKLCRDQVVETYQTWVPLLDPLLHLVPMQIFFHQDQESLLICT